MNYYRNTLHGGPRYEKWQNDDELGLSGIFALIRVSLFTGLAKIEYEPHEKCAHEQKKLSRDKKILAVSKSFRGIFNAIHIEGHLQMIVFPGNTVLEFATKSNPLQDDDMSERGFQF